MVPVNESVATFTGKTRKATVFKVVLTGDTSYE